MRVIVNESQYKKILIEEQRVKESAKEWASYLSSIILTHLLKLEVPEDVYTHTNLKNKLKSSSFFKSLPIESLIFNIIKNKNVHNEIKIDINYNPYWTHIIQNNKGEKYIKDLELDIVGYLPSSLSPSQYPQLQKDIFNKLIGEFIKIDHWFEENTSLTLREDYRLNEIKSYTLAPGVTYGSLGDEIDVLNVLVDEVTNQPIHILSVEGDEIIADMSQFNSLQRLEIEKKINNYFPNTEVKVNYTDGTLSFIHVDKMEDEKEMWDSIYADNEVTIDDFKDDESHDSDDHDHYHYEKKKKKIKPSKKNLKSIRFKKIPGTTDYRSGQPTLEQLTYIMEKYGIKNVIRLSGPNEISPTNRKKVSIEDEREVVEDNGGTLYRIDAHNPDAGTGAIVNGVPVGYINTIKEVNKILNKGHTLIHCRNGSDRTGYLVARYLKDYKGWTDEQKLWDYTTKFNAWCENINGDFWTGYNVYAQGFIDEELTKEKAIELCNNRIDTKKIKEDYETPDTPGTYRREGQIVIPPPDRDIKFYQDVLKGIGATPTEEKMLFFYAWKKGESAQSTYNPFATTQSMGVDKEGCYYNCLKGYKASPKTDTDCRKCKSGGTPGVRNYNTHDIGVEATVKTLLNGHYNNIVRKLRDDNITATSLADEVKELKTWGTGSLPQQILQNNKVIEPDAIATVTEKSHEV